MTNVSLNAKTSDDEDKDEFHVKKRMAMLDLLLSAEARGENIDENGIHEEVDTFTFEVSLRCNLSDLWIKYYFWYFSNFV